MTVNRTQQSCLYLFGGLNCEAYNHLFVAWKKTYLLTTVTLNGVLSVLFVFAVYLSPIL